MKRELRDAWVADLRNGGYDQGKGKLRTMEDRYCCLGVLCERIPNAYWEPIENEYSGYQSGWLIVWEGSPSEDLIPNELAWKLGLNGNLSDNEVMNQNLLAVFNDRGWSFEQIARIIEETVIITP